MKIRTKCIKCRTESISLAILAGALLAVASFPTAAKNPSMEQEPVYNPATMTDFFATVNEVREVPVGNPLAGLHIVVKLKGDALDVYVGPADFAQKFGITFAKGNEVRVLGSKVRFEG